MTETELKSQQKRAQNTDDPFLLNILESLKIIKQGRSDIEVLSFIISKATMQLKPKESEKDISERIDNLEKSSDKLSKEDISLLKEAFGKDFLTDKYYLNSFRRV
ncbi:MAG: hypothetical protein HC887_11845 [Desulfobacteraceae bacterium]|nr:hypothetical protein [Desulfobacteraceae bacterium]